MLYRGDEHCGSDVLGGRAKHLGQAIGPCVVAKIG